MYKAIFIDLDGTLINDKREVSKEDILILNKLYKEKNIIPIITTGRQIACAEYVANIIGECSQKYIIASNRWYYKRLYK